jgi:hypothetical protein
VTFGCSFDSFIEDNATTSCGLRLFLKENTEGLKFDKLVKARRKCNSNEEIVAEHVSRSKSMEKLLDGLPLECI